MTLQSHANTFSEHVRVCKRDGFARIPGVFSQEEINDMRAGAILSMEGGIELEVRKGFPTILYWPKQLLNIVGDSRLQEIVKLYYGDDNFELETCQWYWHLPGDPDEFAWHTDERFRPGVGNYYLQTAILIDDWTDENSAVEFIPGSHKKPFENGGELRKFVRGERKGVKLHGLAGDVLTWSNTVVHGSERNQSNQSRMYYMHGFRSKHEANC